MQVLCLRASPHSARNVAKNVNNKWGQVRFWRCSPISIFLLAAPGGLARFSPQFRHYLLDEGQVPREKIDDLSDNLLAHLITLETCRADSDAAQEATRALARYFERFSDTTHVSLRRAFMVFYQRSIFSKLSPGETIEEFKDFQEIEAMYATRMERWNAEIRQEGRQEGLQEGQAAVLLRQLTRRFGPLGEQTTERIREASSTDLERWTDNILDARSLDEVFRVH